MKKPTPIVALAGVRPYDFTGLRGLVFTRDMIYRDRTMDIKSAKLVAALGLAVTLAGCTEEKIPGPTADNCAPGMYEKNLAGLSKESNRNEFTANCKSFLAAKKDD